MHRKLEQVPRDARRPLDAELIRSNDPQPAACPLQHRAHYSQQYKADGDDSYEIELARNDGTVHQPLREQRQDEGHHLQGSSQHEQLEQAAPEPCDGADQIPPADGRFWFDLLKGRCRPHFQGDSREMLAGLGQRQGAQAFGGVVNGDLAPGNFGQHHEMGQIPMQDAGHGKLWQAFEIQAHRPGTQTKHLPHVNEITQAGSTNRYGKSRAQFVHGKLVLVVCGDVAHTGQPTFTQRGLQVEAHGVPIFLATRSMDCKTQACNAFVSLMSW